MTAAPSNPPGVYSLPGLDPSGSGRVLDSLAAAAAAAVPLPEAEPQRIALAGRVLDFDTSILQSTPLIAGGKGQASPRPGSSATGVTGSQYRSPTKTAHLTEGCSPPGFAYAPFFFRLGAWKAPWNRQVRFHFSEYSTAVVLAPMVLLCYYHPLPTNNQCVETVGISIWDIYSPTFPSRLSYVPRKECPTSISFSNGF